MGNCCALPKEPKHPVKGGVEGVEHLILPQWEYETPVTLEALEKKRRQFWETEPHYGGSREIWDALQGACATEDLEQRVVIVEAAGIIPATAMLTLCYDERGFLYKLPFFVLSRPQNLILDEGSI